jgi:hypothetical protein
MTTTSDLSSTQKRFDCLAFKQNAQAKIYQETNAMGSQELIAYFRQSSHSGVLGDWWKTVAD